MVHQASADLQGSGSQMGLEDAGVSGSDSAEPNGQIHGLRRD